MINELHPDLMKLDAELSETQELAAQDAWDYMPSKPYEKPLGRTIDNPRDPATGEIQLPPTHPYVSPAVGEKAAQAAVRINTEPTAEA